MLIEKSAQYYLKRARASAKEKEFDVPHELQARKDVNIDELFPLTIACISDLSVKIAKESISVAIPMPIKSGSTQRVCIITASRESSAVDQLRLW